MRVRGRRDVPTTHTDTGLTLFDQLDRLDGRGGRYRQRNPTSTHVLAFDQLDRLDGRGGRCWQRNPTSTHVLASLLEGGASQQAAELCANRHPVAPGQAAADVTAFLKHLHTGGLVG